MKELPSVPTTVELGIKGDYLDSWAGAFVTFVEWVTASATDTTSQVLASDDPRCTSP